MNDGAGIAAQAESLRREVQQLSSLRMAAAESGAVATRAAQLDSLASELREQTDRLQFFRARGLHPYIDPEIPGRLLDATKSHRAAFEKDHSSIANDPEDSGFKWRYRDDLDRLRGSIEGALADAWARHIDSLIPAVVDELLDMFGNVSEFADEIAVIDRLYHTLTAARSEVPRSAADIEDAETAARDLSERWQALSGIPPDVRSFLAAASKQGAALDALTPAVRGWLEENGFLGSLRYVLGGGA